MGEEISRRDAFTALAVVGTGLATGCAASATRAQVPRSAGPSARGGTPLALAGDHSMAPLPFDPSSLEGLSERLITSHHQNNYGGAVRNLNGVERELSQITEETPAFVVTALRERELVFRNSKTLHEAYFGNLGGDGRLGGSIEQTIAEAYGSASAWEGHFRATAMGLGGGSGWVVLGLELLTGALRTSWSGSHSQVLAASMPLLVLDMYEHSYHLDYGAEHARYVDAFFRNIHWEEVERRFVAAKRALGALAAQA